MQFLHPIKVKLAFVEYSVSAGCHTNLAMIGERLVIETRKFQKLVKRLFGGFSPRSGDIKVTLSTSQDEI